MNLGGQMARVLQQRRNRYGAHLHSPATRRAGSMRERGVVHFLIADTGTCVSKEKKRGEGENRSMVVIVVNCSRFVSRAIREDDRRK